MRSRRLDRLSFLTQGIALIGLAGCQKDGPPAEPPHINAPAPSTAPTETTTAPSPVVASASASNAPIAAPDPPHVNSPPPGPPKVNSPKPPKHTNSPPN